MAKITKTIKKRNLKSTSNLQVKNRRTGEVVADVFVKNTQVGTLAQDVNSNPFFDTHGIYRAYGGVSGSITRLTDGRSYLVAGTGVSILSQSNGQVTINASSIDPAKTITFGNGFNPNGGTYNGTSDVSVTVDPGDGIGVDSNGVKLNFTTLSTVTPVSADTVAILQSSGGNHRRATINDILNLGISSNVSLSNALTFGDGLAGSNGSTSYNNSAARTVSVSAENNKGVAVTSAGVKIDPGNLSSATVASTDRVIIGDVNDSNNVKYVTAQSIADLATVSNLSNALTIGNGVQLDSGTTFDGSAARTLSIDLDGSTLSVGASGVSVSSVPNSLGNGNGINTFSFDGSSSTSVSLKVKSDGGLVSTNTDGVAMQVSNLPTAVPVYGDFLSFYDVSGGSSGMSKVSIQDFSDIFISGSGGGGGGSIAVSSGSVTVNNVDSIDVSKLGILQSLGSGDVSITGSIGLAEDGSYTDGLFTDFTPITPVGTAVDRFNEVLKGLAPGAAPSLDDMDSNSSGTGAKLSFGSSQAISGYTNVQPSGLTPSSNLSNIDINGTYSSTETSNDIRSACFNGASNVEGTLNEDISADGVNYPDNSFGNGDQGTLSLYINDNGSAAHTTDLSSFGSGNSLNGNGSGFFDLSAADPAHFADGTTFSTFKHRTGSFRVHTADQRNGWNYARVTHTVGASTTTTNYVEWVNDPDSNALASAGSALDTLSMTGLRYLSGVKYNTAGTAQYRIRVTNAYRNIYPTSNITFNGTRCAVSGQAFPAIDHAGGEDETKVLHITGSATIDTDPILNNSISVSANVPAVLKSSLSSVGSQSISGILLYNLSNTSTTTSETFRRENYRLISGSYDAQSDVSAGGSAWDSEKHVSGSNSGHQDGMIFYNSRLYSPNQGGSSGDFRNSSDGGNIANGPGDNVNYSGITSGTRTFYRYFENTSGGSKSNFSLAINGSGTIVQQSTSLNTSNIHVLLKIPTTSASFTTGWMDLAVAFATGQNSDGSGCLDGSLDSSLDATNGGTFGTQSVGAGEFIMVKVEADASWTGYISEMSITWS